MSTHSKKRAEDGMHGDVFGDLSALASDDSGEINSFANEVINREVVAGNWRENLLEHAGDAWRWIRRRGDQDKIRADQLFNEEQTTKKLLDAADSGLYHRVLKDPKVFRVFDTEIDKQAQAIVSRAIANTRKTDPDVADAMMNQKGKLASAVKNLISSSIKKGGIKEDATHLIVNVDGKIKTNGFPDIEVQKIKLSRTDFQNRMDELKIKQTETAKQVAEVQSRIDKRPMPQKGQAGKDPQGRVRIFNGKTWVLIGAAGLAYYNKDKLPDIIQSFRNPNSDVKVGPGQSSTPTPYTTDGNTYDLGTAHDTDADIMQNVNPGGANPNPSSNPTQTPKAYGQDEWDKLKSPPPSQRRKFESGDDDGWWNAPSTSKPTYDDMGYIGSADESWNRTAQKIAPDDLDDDGLSSYGADQILAAQNFLSYYGLGTDKQPGEQIIPSLLMGNFDGMSFDEYKRTHSEEEVRHAMQRFEKGLSMFSEEMTKLANNLESFYQARQRRSEAKKPNQPVQKPNEEPQRTE